MLKFIFIFICFSSVSYADVHHLPLQEQTEDLLKEYETIPNIKSSVQHQILTDYQWTSLREKIYEGNVSDEYIQNLLFDYPNIQSSLSTEFIQERLALCKNALNKNTELSTLQFFYKELHQFKKIFLEIERLRKQKLTEEKKLQAKKTLEDTRQSVKDPKIHYSVSNSYYQWLIGGSFLILAVLWKYYSPGTFLNPTIVHKNEDNVLPAQPFFLGNFLPSPQQPLASPSTGETPNSVSLGAPASPAIDLLTILVGLSSGIVGGPFMILFLEYFEIPYLIRDIRHNFSLEKLWNLLSYEYYLQKFTNIDKEELLRQAHEMKNFLDSNEALWSDIGSFQFQGSEKEDRATLAKRLEKTMQTKAQMGLEVSENTTKIYELLKMDEIPCLIQDEASLRRHYQDMHPLLRHVIFSAVTKYKGPSDDSSHEFFCKLSKLYHEKYWLNLVSYSYFAKDPLPFKAIQNDDLVEEVIASTYPDSRDNIKHYRDLRDLPRLKIGNPLLSLTDNIVGRTAYAYKDSDEQEQPLRNIMVIAIELGGYKFELETILTLYASLFSLKTENPDLEIHVYLCADYLLGNKGYQVRHFDFSNTNSLLQHAETLFSLEVHGKRNSFYKIASERDLLQKGVVRDLKSRIDPKERIHLKVYFTHYDDDTMGDTFNHQYFRRNDLPSQPLPVTSSLTGTLQPFYKLFQHVDESSKIELSPIFVENSRYIEELKNWKAPEDAPYHFEIEDGIVIRKNKHTHYTKWSTQDLSYQNYELELLETIPYSEIFSLKEDKNMFLMIQNILSCYLLPQFPLLLNPFGSWNENYKSIILKEWVSKLENPKYRYKSFVWNYWEYLENSNNEKEEL